METRYYYKIWTLHHLEWTCLLPCSGGFRLLCHGSSHFVGCKCDFLLFFLHGFNFILKNLRCNGFLLDSVGIYRPREPFTVTLLYSCHARSVWKQPKVLLFMIDNDTLVYLKRYFKIPFIYIHHRMAKATWRELHW